MLILDFQERLERKRKEQELNAQKDLILSIMKDMTSDEKDKLFQAIKNNDKKSFDELTLPVFRRRAIREANRKEG